ncbi:haloacid dehalogenase-like hydrolase [Micromonospora peucetia]|uniref:Haloacid dehalogenase-like hydrolase n=1 Tax=Micromonospora peucetia TaxID=47871 RepID=A0ABZ1EJM7_9ACTN|nr:haloacid dehalogenase-like hydrolase [Micromonospora peucetia]MCX4387082.1 haloacid dehalogenase-like hydrolase [Micromonospora peucetia]WSA34446.1 haloacid dehalogenase-like hydrolase [Micromonospora peucetia]
MATLTVGFDLDMTLVDSRPGIADTFRALTARTGVPVDADAAVARLGPPLRTEIARWFPPEQIDAAVRTYRELYPAYAITPTVPLPGALAAIDAVRGHGGRVLVVTAKLGRLARLHLDHLGLVVDEVAGDLFAEQKATALRRHGATHYVGDHVADMVAAGVAGVPGIAVATGPCTADELRAAGAEVVLDDLTGFPAALDGMIRLALER